MMYPRYGADNLKRAGYEVTPLTGDALFQSLLEHPEGILVGRLDPDRNLEELRTEDKTIHLYIEEMAEWMLEVEPEKERAAMRNRDYPFVLMAGRHFPFTANVIMRDPAWNDHKEVCAVLISAEDAQDVGVVDGGDVWISTEASRVKIQAEISPVAQKGIVVIPHGFGLDYDGQVYGVNVNQLTKNTHRDRLAGTPLHRYVPCRIDPA
jgi:anaerobic selenocysteine-containing dehydrogenase